MSNLHSKKIRDSGRATIRGFTLIEVILAIAILAIMISLNYRILRGIIQAKQLIDDRRDGMYIANSVLTRLSRELQLAVKRPILPSCQSANNNTAGAPPTDQANTGIRPVLLGESGPNGTSITFLAKEAGQYIPDGGTHSGVVQINYRAAKDPDKKDAQDSGLLLIREETPNTKPLIKACKNILRFPITSNLMGLEFRYFDGKSKEWSETWDSQRAVRLPDIIQFTVRLKSPAGEIQTYTSAVKVTSAS